MPLRLLLGLLKGLVLGGLVGYAIAAVGLAVPGALLAYPMAAVVGMAIALVAGKPIWAKGARIEVGTKAAAGAILAPGLMWLTRSFLTLGLPFDPNLLPGISANGATLGTFAITSLAIVAAVLGGFFDADNQPGPNDDQAPSPGPTKARIAGQTAAPEAEEEAEDETEAPKRRRA